MSSTASGQYAEQRAAEYLRDRGYYILERNWKRPDCEIDIVATKDMTVYLVEVKYRASDAFGGGLEYIAAQKLRHMRRAAEAWVGEHDWTGEYLLAAIELSGPEFAVRNFIENIY